MIEELLLAMDGYPGDLFYPASNSSNSEESKWRVAPELVDSLHPGEEELVSKLLILSNYVFQFKKFAEIYGPAAFLRQVVPRTDGSTAAEVRTSFSLFSKSRGICKNVFRQMRQTVAILRETAALQLLVLTPRAWAKDSHRCWRIIAQY